MILIIGGNSFIGKHLYEHFSKKERVIATYFSKPYDEMIYFDITNPDLNSLGDLSQIKYAIICSAIGRIDDCKKDEKKSYKINAEGTKKLIENLFKKNIIPIFLSSSYVFDGSKKNPKEEDERKPGTIYGKQKKEIEDFLLKSGRKFLTIRLSKVYGLEKGDGTLLTGMIENISKNEFNKYASDQIMSPVFVRDVVKVIDLAIQKNLSGLYNVSEKEKLSWYDLANLLNEKFKLDKKIIPCSIKDFNFLENTRPLNTGLNPEKIIKETEVKFLTIGEAIEKLKDMYGKE